jgi:hypothetical protein
MTVIPGREANPEVRDSGFDADASPRNDNEDDGKLKAGVSPAVGKPVALPAQ